MDSLKIAAVGVFWTACTLVIYAYVGYPILVSILSRLFGKTPRPPELAPRDLPSVSLLISAYNEEAVIARRIETALSTDYPVDRFEIVVASDGSNDGTVEIVRRYASQGVRLLDYKERRGKSEVLNASVAELSGDIVLFSDANTETEPDAVRKLARWFADPEIGAVCGRLILYDACTSRNVDGLYWKYENHLKRCDARIGGLLGANGAVYALRKSLFRPIPTGTIIDDFVIPLQAKLEFGISIVYECEAIAREETAMDVHAEFRRRSRIGSGGCQCIGLLWPLLNPLHGWIAFTFFSHKICRWICPLAMVAVALANLVLLDRPFYQAALATQVLFYFVAGLAAFVPGRSRPVRILRLTTMFVAMNAALSVGIWRWLAGQQKGSWNRTVRAAEVAAGAVGGLPGFRVANSPIRGEAIYDMNTRNDGRATPALFDSPPNLAPVAASSAVPGSPQPHATALHALTHTKHESLALPDLVTGATDD